MPRSKPPRKKASNAKRRTKAGGGDLPPLPDLRAMMERAMTEMLGAEAPDDPLDRAQELIYDAWEAGTRKQRVTLAKEALAISPLCADAYVILAEDAEPGSAEQRDLFRQGVEAGEQALGEAVFEEDAGHFWGLLETRPYMRACLGLAQTLWARGAHDEALAHYRDMLRLNPNDNQGVRYLLAARYLELARDADLAMLLKAYDDDGTAAWTYTKALLSFRHEGDTAASRRSLIEAFGSNRHVPDYLLGRRRMPTKLPPYMGIGDVDEAVYYVAEYGEGWARTPAALDWLARTRAAMRPRS